MVLMPGPAPSWTKKWSGGISRRKSSKSAASARRSGSVTWDVETTKGPRHFLVRNMKDSTFTLGASRVMMTDVDGNRYEIPDAYALGPQALVVLAKIL